MKIEHDLIFSLGAAALRHINGTRASHLHGTEALLLEWGARPTLCAAGRCHAIYGTDGYPAGFRAYRRLLGNPRDGSLRNVSLRVPATTTTGEHMLQLRPNCECCDKDLPPESTEARICSFECTFCASCADTVLGGKCPNCGGEFVPRPRRPAHALAKFPASSERVYKPRGCGKAA